MPETPWYKRVFVHNGSFVTLADLAPESVHGGGRLVYNSNHGCLFVQPEHARPLSFRSGIMRGTPRDCVELDAQGVEELDSRALLAWRNDRSRSWVERWRLRHERA